QGDEPVTRRDIKNAFLTAIAPVRESAAGELSRSSRTAGAFALAVCPHQLTCGCIECDNGTPRSRSRVHNAVDHQRRSFELILRPRAEIVGFKGPGDSKFVEIRSVDLVQRRVMRVSKISAVCLPLSILGSGLCEQRAREQDQA